jgi:cytohesin
MAAERGCGDSVRLLLEHACGADVTRRCTSGSTSLRLARIEPGAGPALRNSLGRTLLHLAAERGSGDFVGLLLEQAFGADTTQRDAFGRTPLHLARSADAARRLLDAGLDPNDVRRCSDSPLHCAAYDAPDVVRVLLAAGADPDLRNMHGRTPLHLARSKAVVEMLVGAGARLDARDNRGQTPLGWAVELLGAHNDATRGAEHTLLVEALVAAGADPFAQLATACAPLVKPRARIAIVRMLARSPRIATARRDDTLDAQGRTPLDLARSAGAKDVEAALRKGPWARLWADA